MTDSRIRYVGLDVHKHVVEACVVNAAGKVVGRERFALSRQILATFAAKILRPADQVALEATTNCWAVADALRPHVARVVVSNPMATQAIAQAKVKTDKVDAQVLAQLLRCDFLPEVWPPDEATRRLRELTGRAIEQVGLTEAADRKVAAYSKGMRQRIRLAQAIAHDPRVLILDEPLNGLDPLVRAETIAAFREFGEHGRHVILSSHVLQEVDVFSDQVILIANGAIMAEGEIRSVREEIHEHPSQYLLRCRDASRVASLLFNEVHVNEVKILDDGSGLLVMTRNRDGFSSALERIALSGIEIDGVIPADENVDALYEYLIGGGR